jgi:hypothetical protein
MLELLTYNYMTRDRTSLDAFKMAFILHQYDKNQIFIYFA